MMGGTVMAMLGGLHYWWPKIFGRMYPERTAQVTATLVFIGFNLTFLPQFVLGYLGMPRRYYNYAPRYQPLHIMSTMGAYLLGASLLFTFAYLLWTFRKPKDAPANPWGARSLEWSIPSPPPIENFTHDPIITEAYPYGEEFDHQGIGKIYGGTHV
jgi:cytochrome c oxidase subunit 1